MTVEKDDRGRKRCIWVEYRENRIGYNKYCGSLRPITYKKVRCNNLLKMRNRARTYYLKYKKREAERRRRYKIKERKGEEVSSVFYEVHDCDNCKKLKEYVNLFWGVTLCDRCYYNPEVIRRVMNLYEPLLSEFRKDGEELYKSEDEDIKKIGPNLSFDNHLNEETNLEMNLEGRKDLCSSDEIFSSDGEGILRYPIEGRVQDLNLHEVCLKNLDDFFQKAEGGSDFLCNNTEEDPNETQKEWTGIEQTQSECNIPDDNNHLNSEDFETSFDESMLCNSVQTPNEIEEYYKDEINALF